MIQKTKKKRGRELENGCVCDQKNLYVLLSLFKK